MSSAPVFPRPALPPAGQPDAFTAGRRRPRLWIWVWVAAAAGWSGGPVSLCDALTDETVGEYRVLEVSPQHPIVILSGGRDAGVSLGDHVLILRGGELAAAGRVFYLEADRSGVRLPWLLTPPGVGDRAVVVSTQRGRLAPPALAEGINLRSMVDAICPGSATAWMDGGARQGWRIGDALLIHRDELPVTTASIIVADTEVSLMRVADPIFPATRIRPGDAVERLGAAGDASAGCVTRVASVLRDGEPHQVLLADVPDSQIAMGDRFDFYRGQAYVGFGRAVSLRPDGVVAEIETALSKGPCRPGDVALRRLPAHTSVRRTGFLFRIEGDYALATIGEADGLRAGDRLRSAGEPAYELAVDAVYPHHCGARLVSAATTPPRDLQLWDAVVTTEGSPPAPTIPADAWKRESPDWLVGIDPATCPGALEIGNHVILEGPEWAAGVVVARTPTRVWVHVNDGWYGLPDPSAARAPVVESEPRDQHEARVHE
jgi:hypothetical protein